MNSKYYDISLIKDYLAGRLDNKAMHDLERRALEDPLLAEAIEGLMSEGGFSASALDAGLDRLTRRLDQRVQQQKLPDGETEEGVPVKPLYETEALRSQRTRIGKWWAAAAVLLLLLGGGWLYLTMRGAENSDTAAADAYIAMGPKEINGGEAALPTPSLDSAPAGNAVASAAPAVADERQRQDGAGVANNDKELTKEQQPEENRVAVAPLPVDKAPSAAAAKRATPAETGRYLARGGNPGAGNRGLERMNTGGPPELMGELSEHLEVASAAPNRRLYKANATRAGVPGGQDSLQGYNEVAASGFNKQRMGEGYLLGQPGSGQAKSVIVRGTGHPDSLDQPLVIVDGKIVGVDRLEDLDPNRLARVEVLSPEDGAALYGAKGASGAVYITLRPGQQRLGYTDRNLTRGQLSVAAEKKFEQVKADHKTGMLQRRTEGVQVTGPNKNGVGAGTHILVSVVRLQGPLRPIGGYRVLENYLTRKIGERQSALKNPWVDTATMVLALNWTPGEHRGTLRIQNQTKQNSPNTVWLEQLIAGWPIWSLDTAENKSDTTLVQNVDTGMMEPHKAAQPTLIRVRIAENGQKSDSLR